MAAPAFDKNFVLNTMYPAANAAYLVMSVPAPPLALPEGYVMVDTIKADASKGAQAMAQAQADQQRIANAAVSESSIFGLIAWNDPLKSVIVAIRGTKTIWEWLGDFDAAPLPYLPEPGAGLAHMGFQIVYEQIRDSILQLLAAAPCTGAQQIFVTGHSLGGALAVLAAFDIVRHSGLKPTPQMITFAGPRTTDPVFARTFNQWVPGSFRIVNFMDAVPQVPLPPPYEHVGTEILVHGGFKPLDITYAHHLTTYLAGLQKYQPPVTAQAPAPAPVDITATVTRVPTATPAP
ncbi:lipase family protein [Paracidobacterium acidisoli]|uniref:Lipase family protein n=1 Tax=Paracidobacterium acidisoli TaxID=2303751 RepID=A0A372INK2_9BACT|nr:lipase family protein [Paracidobacterium acidisoli]MBT9332148.1 lipase family protein [Paracidobacterium acidisoli]